MLMKTNKLMILLLFVFCQCANENKKTPESEECETIQYVECETIQYDELTTITCGDCFPEVSDKYVHPPMQNERPFFNGDPYNERYQVPDDVLKSISTPGLIDALIQSPYFTWQEAVSFDVSTYRWHWFYEFFNSAREMFQRKDAGSALVTYYKIVKFLCIFSSEYEQDQFSGNEQLWRLVGLENLFTKQEILDKMDHETKKEAVAAFLANCEIQQYHDSFRIYPMAHIMLADQYEPIVKYSQEHVDEFALTLAGYSYYLNPNQYDIIVSFAKDFIND